MTAYSLAFLTPLFSRGSYESVPEVRPPSIRGQLHWWFRALGGSYAEEKAIFGGVHSGGALASKVVVRVSNVVGSSGTANTLPHKQGGHASPKAAYLPGTSFTLHVLERLGGLEPAQKEQFNRCLRTWLLAGSLGLRATRAGGAFQWSEAPTRPDELREALADLLKGSSLRAALLEPPFSTAEAARMCATDTITHQATVGMNFPLGAVKQGPNDPFTRNRKTSPLRLTVRRFDDGYRLIAIWDNRTAVTGNAIGHLEAVIGLLADGGPHSAPKRIGKMLRNSGIVPRSA